MKAVFAQPNTLHKKNELYTRMQVYVNSDAMYGERGARRQQRAEKDHPGGWRFSLNSSGLQSIKYLTYLFSGFWVCQLNPES